MLAQIRQWWAKHWLITSFFAFGLNIELIVIPGLHVIGVQGRLLTILAITCANLELWYWYLLPLEGAKEQAREIAAKLAKREKSPLLLELINDFEERGFVSAFARLWDFGRGLLEQVMGWVAHEVAKRDDVSAIVQNRWLKAFLFVMQSGWRGIAWIGLFFLGVIPGLYPIGILLCRAARSRIGIAIMMVGNGLKIAGITKFYSWSPHLSWTFFAVVFAIAFVRSALKKREKHDSGA